ncbi:MULTISPECIES: hypothetical protein [Aerococcus]|uniref:Uncharacterized protein n=1 Tax=Aerococcus sanguinicola TaxID=119206 RepID=A0A0X8FA98_9LACT|nr:MULTISPECIES: hypothetical protein [Aerococcus]AMB93644.1 hypothetical protein AWM72_02185 [Aerococcus sanguinicola]MDK7050982.1 hypothetical protein [Aerococcus sanguinicola]OFT95295.1 hypothetical protein HMPREF3090_04670 [Aerococcus sp. HMSC23C02]PKZ21627.1 hypothetical protein CYJ28_06910 [Aerococcus sanguinicola]
MPRAYLGHFYWKGEIYLANDSDQEPGSHNRQPGLGIAWSQATEKSLNCGLLTFYPQAGWSSEDWEDFTHNWDLLVWHGKTLHTIGTF